MIAAWYRDLVAPRSNEPGTEPRAQAQNGTVAEPSQAQAQSGTVAEPSRAQAQSGTVAEPIQAQAQSGTVAEPSRAQAQSGTVAEPSQAQAQSGTVAEPSRAQAQSGTVAEPSQAQAQSGMVAEPSRAQAQSGTVAEPSKKVVCRAWPGKWGRKAEVIPTVNLASPEGDVWMDPALWGELHRHIDIQEMVVARLPLHAFYRARGVCKKWNSLPWNRPFLEQHSTTSLPEPYFILHGMLGCHQAILVKDVMLEKWVLKPLPAFAFQHNHTSVAHGVVSTCTHEGYSTSGGCVVRGTVFNIHTKVFRRLPPLTVAFGAFECSKIAVDKHSGSYKVLVAASQGRQIWVFESVNGVWTQKAVTPAIFCCVDDSTHCQGVMYIKWRGALSDVIMPPGPPPGVPMLGPPGPPPPHVLRAQRPKMFAYNFRDDVWTDLPMAPPPLLRIREAGWEDIFVRGLGEWRGALRDVTFDSADEVLRMWEFEHSRQEWLEVDRMPTNILEWFLDPQASSFESHCRKIIKTSYCEHYILMWNHCFPQTSGVARLVLYDMALKSWETLAVGKDWICSQCPFDT